MQLLNLIMPVLLSTTTAVGEVIKTSEGCVNTSYPPLHLTCGSHHRIHVISITYQKTTIDCQPSVDACQVTQLSRSDGFSTTCNGLRNCLESIQDFWITDKCGDVPFFKVSMSYECISDSSIIDVCNTTTARSETGMLYMASPNYYNPISTGPGRPCICNVSGQEMVLEILELYLRQVNSVRANFTLTTKNKAWSSTHHSPVDYNNIVLQDVSMVKIHFNTQRRYGQMMWIRITGSSEINVSCNGGTRGTVILPGEPSNPVDDGNTSAVAEGNNSKDTLTVVAIVCGVIILLLLIIIMSLVVYLKLQGSRRSRTNYNISRYDPTDISYIHYDNGSVATEYDTNVGHQIPTRVNGHCDGEHQYSHLNEYTEPASLTKESEADRLYRGDSYTSRSNLAYQRDQI